MELRNLDISLLVPADYNPRKATKRESEQIRKSLEEFGTVEPAVVNMHPGREYTIIGGHQRVQAAKDLGWTEYPCSLVNLPLAAEKRLNLKLNKIGAQWDADKLTRFFDTDTLLDCGFTQFDLNLKLSAIAHKDLGLPDLGKEATQLVPDSYDPPEPRQPEMRSATIADTRQKVESPRHYPLAIVLNQEEYAQWCKAKELLECNSDKPALLQMAKRILG